MSSPDDIIYRVVTALADAEGVSPDALEYNLSSYIDPDVLINLASFDNGSWQFTFDVDTNRVVITSDGSITVTLHGSAPSQADGQTALPAFCVAIDTEGRITNFLEVTDSPSGLSHEAIVGRFVHNIANIPADSADRLLTALKETRDTGRPHPVEYEVANPSSTVQIDAHTVRMPDAVGVDDGIVLISHLGPERTPTGTEVAVD